MILYCWPHRATHHFTPPQVEKIVYALTAAFADAATARDDERFAEAGARSEDHFPCLLEVHRWTRDIEMYAEHVEQGITCRRDRPPSPPT